MKVEITYETPLKYLNMFYGNFQYRRIMALLVATILDVGLTSVLVRSFRRRVLTGL